ncbi:uncharacterized protein BT62DRAFT_933452 [Guyanagaster necrorhizus]|uniref:Uncharacterized protein n=1 Tax=Guyanagaster necrorhizus TaxID=856835 RepID=A0A9P7VQN7_9AGAR|nr:uncharacterized protein BT62DRAFT_933452 [Guyanagaster necrorhizus MCA 3950]KAG7445037.1 hypothetical protein BT62DRAFT_933452 [Guyanagaster necrorhizus MCA 3950]
MDPIRSVYITMDDQDIIQQNESLERENEELKAQIRELEGEEAEAEEAEEADMQFTPPSPSNMVMYVTNTGNATGAFFRPAIRVSPPYPPAYRVRSAHSYTPVVPNRPSLGQTVLGTPTSTRQLPSAPPAGLGGFSTRATDHNTSTSAFTNPFARPTAAQTSAPSTLGPPGPVQRPETQWIVPPNHVPNQSQAAPAADNFLNVTRTITFSRRESRHFVAPPAPDPGSPSPAYTTVDVPASSSASGAENRRPSQSS